MYLIVYHTLDFTSVVTNYLGFRTKLVVFGLVWKSSKINQTTGQIFWRTIRKKCIFSSVLNGSLIFIAMSWWTNTCCIIEEWWLYKPATYRPTLFHWLVAGVNSDLTIEGSGRYERGDSSLLIPISSNEITQNRSYLSNFWTLNF